MKKINLLILIALVMFGSSCKKFLDINENPNQATYGTPFVMLPQAITFTAAQLNTHNTMGAQLGGYMANAGGFGGFGSNVTYNFSTSDFAGCWNVFDALEDYQQVIEQTAGVERQRYYNSIARIMKAHGFQLLVDAYNSVPYSEALGGLKKLTPKYDDPAAIYADLVAEIDRALDTINMAQSSEVQQREVAESEDPMFHGNMNLWKRFANTLKLRIILTANGKVNFSDVTFDPIGFLTTDALVDPGYIRTAGKQNPKWNSWAYTTTGSAGRAWMPTTFVMQFYNGGKLNDPGRGAAIYYQYPSTATNRLGNESNDVTESPEGNFWYPSSTRSATAGGNATGVLKGPDASMPVITAAESYFLQAEGLVRGIITSDKIVDTLFINGIKASFKYLYALPNGTYPEAFSNPEGDAEEYLAENSESRLVNLALATTNEQKLEAIITQKYIALNMVNSNEAWDDYRRTHYPTIISSAGATGAQTFASQQSGSSRPDKLPTRILYPTSEGSYNTANVPKGINPYSSLIFWALP